MRAYLMHVSWLAFAAAVMLAITGCGAGPLYVQTAGTAGPLQWEAVDLASGREMREGKEVDTYEFTLVLRETRGIGLNFTNVSSSIYGGGWGGFGRHAKNLPLSPYCELRLPLSATGFKSPLWFVTLSGKDEGGKAVTITITVALPPNPTRPSTGQSPSSNELPLQANVDSDLTQSGNTLAMMSLEDRRRLRAASIGVNPTDVAALLATDASRLAVPVANGIIRFDPRVPLVARRGLRNIAGWLLSGVLPKNATVTVPLDTAYRQDLSPALRFTHISQQQETKTCQEEVLIENADSFIDFSKSTDLSILQRHGFTLKDWSDDESKALAAVLSHFPAPWLRRLEGVAFRRQERDPAHPDYWGNYNSRAHAVTMYDLAFRPLKFGFTGADKTADAIAHELGHAFDFAPLRTAADRLYVGIADLERSFGRFKTSDGRYAIPPEQEKAWQEKNAKLTSLENAVYAARSESGSRWRFVPDAGVFEMVDPPESESAFRKAAAEDGPIRITEYAEQSWSEYFAECFSLYVLDPEILELLRPNIYAYFAKQFPR